MEYLLEKYHRRLNQISLSFTRYLMNEIKWDYRLIGIKGARGTGKTTLLLQYIKKNISAKNQALYASLDDIYFSNHRLIDVVDTFYKTGGKYLFLDEVHYYPDWSIELKNIYDTYPDLHVVFSGSSLLNINEAQADLSRRAVIYTLQGLSFREYLSITTTQVYDIYSLEDIINHHEVITAEMLKTLKPYVYFADYLRFGYYPYFLENNELYYHRLESTVNMIIDIELPRLKKVDVASSFKIKQLLQVIAESAPFVPNIMALSQKTQINRNTLINYLYYLQEAGLTVNMHKRAKGISRMQKPDKIFLDNTNLYYLLAPKEPNMGSIRETFFVNQIKKNNYVEYAEIGDFRVNEKFTFEIGGKNKSKKTITDVNDAFVVKDGIEYGFGNTIPLWLFGFLY